jgi:hypothetical protein
MMDCKQINELLIDYLYQELDPGQAERFEAHLQSCARCAKEVSSYESTRAMMQDLPQVEPPLRLSEFLLSEAKRSVRPTSPDLWARVREAFRFVILHPAMTAAVTLVLVLGVSFYVYQRSSPQSDRVRADLPLATEIDKHQPVGHEVTASKEPQAQSSSQVGGAPPLEAVREGQAEKARGENRPEKDEGKGTYVGGGKFGRSGKGKPVRLARKADEAMPSDDDRSIRLRKRTGGLNEAADKEVDNYAPGMRPTTVAKQPRPEPAKSRRAAQQVGQGGAKPLPPAAAPSMPAEEKSAKRAVQKPMFKTGASKSEDLDALVQQAEGESSLKQVAPLKKGRVAPSVKAASAGQEVVDPFTAYKGSKSKKSVSKSPPPRPIQGKLQAAKREKQMSAAGYVALADRATLDGRCNLAFTYYSRALELEAKLLSTITAKIRTCAVQLASKGQTLPKDQKLHPQLYEALTLEVQRERSRQERVNADQTQDQLVSKKAKASTKSPAKGKAKAAGSGQEIPVQAAPAKTNTSK